MGAAFQWLIYTPDGEFRLVRRQFDMPVPPKLGPIERMVIFVAGNAVKRCEHIALAAAIELCGEGRVHGLYSSSLSPFEPTVSHAVAEDLADELEYAIRSGKVLIEEIKWTRIRPAVVVPPVVPGNQPTPPAPQTLSWFEVVVVDELGIPVDATDITFSVGAQKVNAVTDGSGRARAEGLLGSFASARFASEAKVRNKLYARWAEARGKEWPEPPTGSFVIQVRQSKAIPDVSVTAEKPQTVVLRPRVVRARLFGTWFDTSKCFLLPTARTALPQLQTIYDDNEGSGLLIIGHTDTQGTTAYNDVLSVERADSMQAFLTDKVEDWYAWYSAGKPEAKRWGEHEDVLMIMALDCPLGVDPIRWYQERQGMPVTGIANSELRHALIKEYMALDGTTLPASISPVTHGCGENFPVVPTPNETREGQNRCTELYFFDSPILPPPPGKNSPPGSKQYPEWVLRSKATYDIDADVPPDQIRIRLHDSESKPMTEVPYRLTLAGGPPTPPSIASTGWVFLQLPASMCGQQVIVEWGEVNVNGTYPYQRDIFVDCGTGTEREQARVKLHNVGYPSEANNDTEYDSAVREFQEDYGIAEEGLNGGELPPATRAKLWSIYESDCDATRPALPSGKEEAK